MKNGPLPPEFYAEFVRWRDHSGGLFAILHRLLCKDLSTFNPKGHAPKTEAREEMIEASRTQVQSWCHELRTNTDTALALAGSHQTAPGAVFTTEDLLRIFNGGEQTKLTAKGMACALRAEGFTRANNGGLIRIPGTVLRLRLWIIRDAQRVGSMSAGEFGAVLGASSYTYAEATWPRNLWDWIHSHIRAFEFFQGTSRLVIPDNWKSGVKTPCYYEPELNRTYGDLAIHYGVGIMPARPFRARDKAKAEVGGQVVQRWVLAALRKRQFFSLAALNEAILELVHKLNQRPFRKLPGSRAELYQSIDRPALQPLPLQPFVFAEWKKARGNLDYHIEVDGHYYSTPYQLVGKEVEARSTRGTVEIVYQGKRIARHARSSQPHVASTIAEHRPKSHQEYLKWTPSRIIDWAGRAGPFTARLVECIIAAKPHPEMGYRSALGVIRLSRKYGAERLEAACTRAVRFKLYRYQSVKSMLECGLASQPLPELVPPPSP